MKVNKTIIMLTLIAIGTTLVIASATSAGPMGGPDGGAPAKMMDLDMMKKHEDREAKRETREEKSLAALERIATTLEKIQDAMEQSSKLTQEMLGEE